MKNPKVVNVEGHKEPGLSEESKERLRRALAGPLLREINEIFAEENKQTRGRQAEPN